MFRRYTHIEAECPFMTYEDLLTRLEDLVCDVVDRVLKSPAAPLLFEVNPVCLAQILQHSALVFFFKIVW